MPTSVLVVASLLPVSPVRTETLCTLAHSTALSTGVSKKSIRTRQWIPQTRNLFVGASIKFKLDVEEKSAIKHNRMHINNNKKEIKK